MALPNTTNPDTTAITAAAKQDTATIVGDTVVMADNAAIPTMTTVGRRLSVPAGAMPPQQSACTANFKDMSGIPKAPDLRVKIRVPANYLVARTWGPNKELFNNGGVIFPYTPTISYEHKADYASANPMHSNFTLYFYKNSAVGAFTISGKFTVQNETDAAIYLATTALLRSLTKMRSGGNQTVGGDPDSGAPPPVCRLDAYGEDMLDNTPIAITSVRVDLPDNVDYFTLGKNTPHPIYGTAMVPTMSIIAVSCVPIYSRAEMQKFSVTGWLGSSSLRKSGLL